MKETDRTIQLKRFYEGEDDPYQWLEWRKIDYETFTSIEQLLRKAIGTPMDRTGD